MCDASILKGLLIFMLLAYELRTPVVVVVVAVVVAAVTSCVMYAGKQQAGCRFQMQGVPGPLIVFDLWCLFSPNP